MPESRGDRPGESLFVCYEDSCRLDRFLQQNLPESEFSRAVVQKQIRGGKVYVDGAAVFKPGFKLKAGQKVLFVPPQSEAQTVAPLTGDVHVVYEDPHLAVLNKAPGLTVHPADSEKGPTLVHFLLKRFPELELMDPERPGIVHRLDKDTSGLMLVARNERARRILSSNFARHEVYKEYLCLCRGVPDADFGVIRHNLERHPRIKTKMAVSREGKGREARSEYRVVFKGDNWSLLRVRIHTGRTHQIRVHLSYEGLPVLGDAVYGECDFRFLGNKKDAFARLVNRQLLHAWQLGFDHPHSKEYMNFLLPPPRDFLRAMLFLHKRPQRVLVVGAPGSGKSEVLRLLRDRGADVWSADSEVSRLYEEGGDGFELLRMSFGDRFVSDSGSGVDKKALFSAMLKNDHLRREVEHLIHPLVRGGLEDFWSRKQGRILAAEVPLFFEAGMDGELEFDVCVGVSARKEIRFSRLKERGWSPEVIEKVQSWQWTGEEKLSRCDLVVDNSGDMHELEESTRVLVRNLRDLRRRRMQGFCSRVRSAFKGEDTEDKPGK
jgi:23S rRNA pseudouridine1911/1915/1917 synthase